jgi:hypothetical protein
VCWQAPGGVECLGARLSSVWVGRLTQSIFDVRAGCGKRGGAPQLLSLCWKLYVTYIQGTLGGRAGGRARCRGYTRVWIHVTAAAACAGFTRGSKLARQTLESRHPMPWPWRMLSRTGSSLLMNPPTARSGVRTSHSRSRSRPRSRSLAHSFTGGVEGGPWRSAQTSERQGSGLDGLLLSVSARSISLRRARRRRVMAAVRLAVDGRYPTDD